MHDSSAFTIFNPSGKSNWILLCEHGSNKIPEHLHNLGLDDIHLNKHIAYDIGTRNMSQYLAEKLDATVVFANYSRLVIDCNRSLIHSGCIPTTSDGVFIPGNQNLSAAEKQQRYFNYFLPFHNAAGVEIVKKISSTPSLKIANIHSFTPMLSETQQPRPWEIGFVHREDSTSKEFINYFNQNTDYCIGDNEPYNGYTHKGYTIPAHADAQDIPSFLVEFRQDLIDTPSGITHWGNLLLTAMTDLQYR